MQSSAGVNFGGAALYADQIIGFSKIQSGGMLSLYQSRVTLTQDEVFAGTVTMSDTNLDCNGYEFRTSNGGNLEQWDGLVNLDHGTLYVDGDYILHCNSILQMIQEDDLLQVKGSFDTQSFMNHSSMLRNGRMELVQRTACIRQFCLSKFPSAALDFFGVVTATPSKIRLAE